jgi:hydrogenase/urease accessory protein HupE
MRRPAALAIARRAAAPAALLAVADAALAHPGHGTHTTDGLLASLAHLITQPDHLALLAIAVAAGWAGARAWQRATAASRGPRRSRR